MSNSPSRPHSGSLGAANLVWLISFGDLLTLLVCFFLVLTPWTNVSFNSEATKQSLTPILTPDHTLGTSLASRSLGLRTSPEQLGEFVLTGIALSKDQEARFQEIITSAGRAISQDSAGTAQMTLEMCGTYPRAELLRRVGSGLVETLRQPLALEVEIDGECRAIQARHPQIENPVAVIKIVHR
jgi:flagellar motor protein MotB